MAEEWIKVRHCLPDDPDVKRLGRLLGVNSETLGFPLVRFWALGDRHSKPRVAENCPGKCPDGSGTNVPDDLGIEGFLEGYTAAEIDHEARIVGFADAMAQIGWLVVYPDGIAIPKWNIHHSKSAKNRALESKKKRTQRDVNALGKPKSGEVCPGKCPDGSGTASQEKRRSSSKEEGADSKSNPKSKKPRERNALFDAIVEVCGLDATLEDDMDAAGRNAAKIGKAKPPYTPDEVRDFGRRFLELCTWAKTENRRPYPNELGKWISKVRAKSPRLSPSSDGVSDAEKLRKEKEAKNA